MSINFIFLILINTGYYLYYICIDDYNNKKREIQDNIIS